MKLNSILLTLLAVSGGITGYFILNSPPEVYMGHVQKIMYVHVPVVAIAYILFFGVFLFSLAYLWKRKERADIYAVVLTEIASLYTFITLVTGSLWGKPTWNTYWTWDAKLTITLILFLIFAGYILIRKLTDPGEQQFNICAVIGVLGFLSVPLNHLSVKWWRSIHQASTFMTPKETVSDEYSWILYLALLTFVILTVYLFRIRLDMEVAGLLISVSREDTLFYYTVNEVITHKDKYENKKIRLMGLVQPDSVSWNANAHTLEFKVTEDMVGTLVVKYEGIKPDMFREGQGVVAEGELTPEGYFTSKTLLVKHSEEYKTPKDAASAAEVVKSISAAN
ncbi:hypothetical protein CHS0354_035362 [Potamilus streckersoni]|uniref:Cytochrome c assembly protein domain-containing protein n=1 Tax=Potamilus streckersoni TaxID=2493646 RepID=A0AAE0VNN2_9BIVA|nr:hypothetical protein CHS0354_035362 [Potamilus streckersoni]